MAFAFLIIGISCFLIDVDLHENKLYMEVIDLTCIIQLVELKVKLV